MEQEREPRSKSMEWQETFANQPSDKRLVYRIYKELL
jgi:hypothetical protein